MSVREIQWGQYQGMRKFETPSEVDPVYRDFLVRILYVQADTEFASVQQHRPWLDRSPTLDDRWVHARIVSEEMRHGWQICKVLEDFGKEGREMTRDLLDKAEGQHKLDSFNIAYESWSDVLAYTCLVDRVGVYQLRAFRECSYGPLARAIPLMIQEEMLHIGFGAGGLKKMVSDSDYPGDKDVAQAAVIKWYPRALDMFGHSGSRGSELAVELGIKQWRNEEARKMYIEEVTKLFSEMGLETPPEEKDRRIL